MYLPKIDNLGKPPRGKRTAHFQRKVIETANKTLSANSRLVKHLHWFMFVFLVILFLHTH